jgi:hypothetical protein
LYQAVCCIEEFYSVSFMLWELANEKVQLEH